MTYRELRRKLENLGCRFDRQAGGSHEIWINPESQAQTSIPRHSNLDL
ncbi:MAG: type II toxin-antitoxin system HicA family toxin [Chloroflexi bacterium]|nr:type II toxin-antitoxin system HicA family toxin [Chloroflexota bacterium]